MLKLYMHCGGHHVDREAAVTTPTPQRTRTWVPVPHGRLLGLVEQTLAGTGMRVVSEAHGLWGEGQRYFGLLQVENNHAAGDHSMVVGLRNSHDRTFPAAIAVGCGVFVCDNLSFSGEVTLSRRHTRFVERDLPGVVARAIGQVGQLRHLQEERIAAYKATPLGNRAAHDLVVRALDARVLPVTWVPEVVEQWRQPNHREFLADGRTAWTLFNAFTEVLKRGNLQQLPRRSQALHGLIDSECGLLARN